MLEYLKIEKDSGGWRVICEELEVDNKGWAKGRNGKGSAVSVKNLIDRERQRRLARDS